ncbi:MAG: hypothetical protein P4L74_00800 [Candidatus Doudnabacteria bacterium]|nr:hypothetical protein [Candidatus Doudnabacteria bacterium]
MQKKSLHIFVIAATICSSLSPLAAAASAPQASQFPEGVLAVNTDQAAYQPGENVYVQMASLDSNGHTLCNSNLELDVTGPDGYTSVIARPSASEGEAISSLIKIASSPLDSPKGSLEAPRNGTKASIQRSSSCGNDNVTSDPDYFVNFPAPQSEGQYQLLLKNLDSGIQIDNAFSVKNNLPLVIKRQSATRINPFKSSYQVNLTVTASRDALGQVEEFVPADFVISRSVPIYGRIENSNADESARYTITDVTDQNLGTLQKLVWPVNLKAGESANLSYTYQSPQISPDLFQIGYAQFRAASFSEILSNQKSNFSGPVIYSENRPWEIASDGICYSKATGNWSSSGTWGGSCTGSGIPSASDDVVIAGNTNVTVDVSAAVAKSVWVASSTPATTTFASIGVLTVTNNFTMGSSTIKGNLDMTNGGEIVTGTFATSGTASLVFKPGSGAIQIGSSETLPNSTIFATYNNLIIHGGTVAMPRALQVAGMQIDSGATLNGSTFLLTDTGNYTDNGTHSGSGGATISGASSIVTGTGNVTNTGTFTVSGASGPTISATSTFSGAVTLSGGGTSAISITGTITVNATLTISGTVQNYGSVTTGSTDTMTGTGSWTQEANSSLTLGGSTTNALNIPVAKLSLNASGNTVTYNRGGTQTMASTTYYNLTVAGTGAKTIPAPGITVNNILDKSDTTAMTFTGSLTYGASATLQYDGSMTSGTEWVTPFVATGGVIINSGTVTMNAASVFATSVPMTVNSGATLSMGNKLLTLGGNLNNNSGTVSGTTGGVTINATSTQSIGAFTTTGTVTMSKPSGTATFTGNVNGAGLTINGSGGTLDLGTGLTHTFTSTLTLTAGTLNVHTSSLSVTTSSGSAATFVATSGSVTYTGASPTVAPVSYNNLTLSGSGKAVITNVSTINGSFTMSGSVNASTSIATAIGGDLLLSTTGALQMGNVAFTVSGNATISSGSLLLISGSSTTTFSGILDVDGTMSGAGAGNVVANGSVVGGGTVTLTGDEFLQRVTADQDFGQNGGNNTWTFKNLNFENGNTANHTITMNAGSAATITVTSLLTIGNSSDNYTTTVDDNTNDNPFITASTTITSQGSLLAPSSMPFYISGNFTNNGSFTHDNGTLTFNPSGSASFNLGNSSAYNITMSGSGTLTGQATITVASVLNIAFGTFNAGASNIILTGSGSPLVNSGTFNAGTSKVSYQGTSGTTTPAGVNYYNLDFAPTGGSPVYNLAAAGGALTYNNIALVQASSTNPVAGSGSMASISQSFDTAVTGGDLLVVGLCVGGTGISPTVTDDKGNTLIKATDVIQSTDWHESYIYYLPNATAGAKTITASGLISGLGWNALHIFEFSGANISSPLDQVATSTGSTVNQASGNAPATSQANELLFGFFGENNSDMGPINPGSIYKAGITAFNGTSVNSFSEYATTTVSGVYAATSTEASTANNYSAAIATFKAGSSGGSGPGSYSVANNLTISGPATVNDYASNTPVTVSGNMTIGSSSTFLAPTSSTFSIAGNFTNNGSFNAEGGTVTFNGSATSTISAAGTTTFSSIYVAQPSNLAFSHYTGANLFNISGTLTATGTGGNLVTIASDQVGSQWRVNFSGAQSAITYAYIKDSGCYSGSATVTETGKHNSDGGNNGSCWGFSVTPAGITVSGTIYDTDASTTLTGFNGEVDLAVASTTLYTVSAVSGIFSFTAEVATPTVGTVLTLWLNTGGTTSASLVFKYGSGCNGGSFAADCAGLTMIKNRVVLDDKNTGSISIADLANCNNSVGSVCSDTDIGFIATTTPSASTTLTFASNTLHIMGGTTFIPGGTVNGQNLNVLGTFSGSNDANFSGGTASGNGSVNLSGGTFTLSGAGNFGGSSSWNFNNLNIGNGTSATTTSVATAITTVTGGLTIGSTSSLNAGSSTFALTGMGTPFTINSGGVFTASTSKVSYQATTGTTTPAAVNYYNLDFAPTSGSPSYSFSTSALAVSNNFTISGPATVSAYASNTPVTVGGNMTISASATYLTGSTATTSVTDNLAVNSGGTMSGTGPVTVQGGTVSGSGTINMTGGTFEVDGTGNFGGSSSWNFNNLNIGNGTSATTTSVASATTTVSGNLTIGSTSSLNAGSSTFALTASGTPFTVNTGGIFTASSSKVSYLAMSGTTTPAALGYYNLDFAPASGSPQFVLPYAFPSTGILDNFNRANQGPPPSSSWTNLENGLDVSSNAVVSNTAGQPNSSYYNTAFGPNQEVYVTASNQVGDDFYLTGRMTNISGANFDGYVVYVSTNGSNQAITIYIGRADNQDGAGSNFTNFTVLADLMYSQTNITIANGDGVGMSIIGNKISAYYRSGSGSWQLIGSATDSTYNSAGYIGIGRNTLGSLDNFGGGTIVPNVSGNLTISGPATVNAYAGNTPVTVSGSMTIGVSAAYSAASSSPLTISGSFINSGTFTHNNGTVILNTAATTTTVSLGSSSLYNMTMFGTGTLTTLGTTTVTNTLAVFAGTLNAGASNIVLSGTGTPFSVTGGTFTASTSKVSYQATSGTTTVPSLSYYNLDFAPLSGQPEFRFATGTLTINYNLTDSGSASLNAYASNTTISIIGNLIIGSGDSFSAPSSSGFTISGSFTNNGTFTHNGGTVTIGTSSATSIISGVSTVFNNLTVAAPGATLQFQSQSGNAPVFSFAGTFAATGTSGSLITIESNTPGTQWLAHFNSAQGSVAYAYIQDSGCDAGTANITTSNSTNGGNNGSCWLGLAAIVSHGGGAVPVDGGSGGGTQVSGGVSGGGGSSAITLISHASTYTTSGAINTTGATLIVAVVVSNNNSTVAPSDNSSNTYTSITQYGTSNPPTGSNLAQFWYVCNPTTSASQTFTDNSGAGSVLLVSAWSGAGCLDTQNGNSTTTITTTSLQSGSITPVATGELLITGVINDSAPTNGLSINSGFTILDNPTSNSPAVADAYLIGSNVNSVNSTWSAVSGAAMAAIIAAFKTIGNNTQGAGGSSGGGSQQGGGGGGGGGGGASP